MRGHLRLMVMSLEVVGDGEMRGALRVRPGQPRQFDGLPQEIMAESEKAGALGQVWLDGEEEGGPQRPRKRCCDFGLRISNFGLGAGGLRIPSQQIEPFGFREALTGGPEVAQGAADEIAVAAFGVPVVEVLLPATDDAGE